jgi:hypothetical protein
MGYYIDGAVDCGVISCPLYSTMPYGKERHKRRVVMTPEKKEKLIEQLSKGRKKKKD